MIPNKNLNISEKVPVTFIDPNKESVPEKVYLPIGENLMHASKNAGVDIEAACEGSCACSTCHIILTPEMYRKYQPPSEKEEDMLDTAFGLTPTSRLACQLKVVKDLKESIIKLPKFGRNIRM